MGLDLGTRTIGIALTDELGLIASPYKTIKYKDINDGLNELIDIIKEKDVKSIALGLPKNMDNSEGEAVERSLEFKKLLEKRVSMPINLVDERLTTVEAYRYMKAEEVPYKKRKDMVDAIAASIILNTYLNTKGNKNEWRKEKLFYN